MSFIIQEQTSPVIFEVGNEEATGAGGTIDFYLGDQDFLYYEGNASANFAIDLAYDASTTLNDALEIDDLATITLAVNMGDTAYTLNNFQIDGGAGNVTLKWQGNSPRFGFSNTINYYIFKILKISSNQYSVFATLTTTPGIVQTREINKGAGGSISLYVAENNGLLYANNASSNYTLNVTYASGTSLNDVLGVNDSITVAVKAPNGASAHNLTTIAIDNSFSGIEISFPSGYGSGIASAIMSYEIEIIKTASAQFSVFVDEERVPLLRPTYQMEYLIQAGGGSGGSKFHGGGGGAGGAIDSSSQFTLGAYTITVGGGGATSGASARGNNGNPSSIVGLFVNQTAVGGGGGGNDSGVGKDGGCGGGGAGGDVSNAGGSGTTSQGFNGGNGLPGVGNRGAGGGGGTGAVGGTATNQLGAAGGTGTNWKSLGTFRGGGGGGSSFDSVASGGAGGTGGGGKGGNFATEGPVAGTVNTGGGGGGAERPAGLDLGAAGGSGIVIIRYPGSAVATGGTITSSGGYTYHTFTSGGTFTVTG